MRKPLLIAAAVLAGLVILIAVSDSGLEDSDEVPKLDPNALYELCPDCRGESDVCLTCFDEGLVAHGCDGGLA